MFVSLKIKNVATLMLEQTILWSMLVYSLLDLQDSGVQIPSLCYCTHSDTASVSLIGSIVMDDSLRLSQC